MTDVAAMTADTVAMTASEIVSLLTVEQKASLCSGSGFWHTEEIRGEDGAVIVPRIMVTDGPHGVRKQPQGKGDHLGIAESVPATCFPTACTTASSFDRSLLHEIGVALGEECLQEKVSVLLGPGLNIKRSPLCGRNFEYFSEDPFVSGEMATAIVRGIQSQGISTSMKHFAANNQERKRLTSNSVVDERALREIYLAGFERVIKEAKPTTVMTSYNRLNGEYTSESKRLLTDILRDEWGFEGLVMTDWGACNDRVLGLAAGQDLEMPASGGYGDRAIAKAVRAGEIDESVLDKAAERLVTIALKGAEMAEADFEYDEDSHHELARKAATESAVLLKNEGSAISGTTGLLPITPGKTLALIGAMAKKPRYQGAGSSRINPTKLDNAWDELEKSGFSATYAAGYADGSGEEAAEELIDEAVRTAAENDIAIVFAGLPEEYESEGFDRVTIDMPDSHNKLIEAVAAANPNTVVVLHAGAPVSMPWADKVQSILLMYLGGQAVGSATVDLLTGKVNPSGKLAETFPLKIEDTPCFSHFAGDGISEEYRESIFVGYRYYDTAEMAVAFPFGFGLSYTTFAYDDLFVYGDLDDDGVITATVTVSNEGPISGAEIVQLYVAGPRSEKVYRPKKELKGFEKLFLEPGERKTITFKLDSRSFSYYNHIDGSWAIEGGEYKIGIAASSTDERLSDIIVLYGDGKEDLLAEIRAKAPMYFKWIAGQARNDKGSTGRARNDGGIHWCVQGHAQHRSGHTPLGHIARNDGGWIAGRARNDSGAVADGQFEAIYGKPLPPHYRKEGEPFDVNSSIDDIGHTLIGKLARVIVPKIMDKMIDKDDIDARAMAESMAFEMPLRALMMQSGDLLKPNGLNAIVAFANGHPLKAIKNLLKKA
jgi:beta-glucosidase